MVSKISKLLINMQLSSNHVRRTRAQSKVAYYPPRSEKHQKVAPERRKNFETIAQSDSY